MIIYYYISRILYNLIVILIFEKKTNLKIIFLITF